MAHKNIFFELGFLKLNDKSGNDAGYRSLLCEEFTFNVQNENVPRYACDIVAPVDLAPTKKKFTFTIKKPKFFESDLLSIHAVYAGDFDLKVYRIIRNSDLTAEKKQIWAKNNAARQAPSPLASVLSSAGAVGSTGGDSVQGNDFSVEHVLTLNHCMVDSDQVGNFDGTKPVSEEIQGQARYVTFSPNVAGYYSRTLQGDNEL